MSTSKPIERIIYTDGSNGVVRLPPLIWRAFYEAAIFLEFDSVQECMIAYLLAGGWISKHTNFVYVVEYLEMSERRLESISRADFPADFSDFEDIPF